MRIAEKNYALIPFALAAGALGVALISQYGFGKHPCDLCILQRIPYLVVMVAAVALLVVAKSRTMCLALWGVVIVAFLATCGIGAYHAMVELGWIAGPDSCSAQSGATDSLAAMKAQIMGAALVSCNNVSVSFLGISMAAWNALYALGCAGVSVFLTHHFKGTVHDKF